MKKDYIPLSKEIIYQDREILSYSIDSVLLDYFAHKKGKVGDVGCGTGYLSIKAATSAQVKEVHAFDIQKKAIDLLGLSARENKLEELIHLHLGDIKDISFPKAYLDTILTNPPFFLGSLEGNRQGVNQAKHLKSMEDWFFSLSPWLKFHGNLYCILYTAHLDDLLKTLTMADLRVKGLRFVHKNIKEEAMRVLVWAKKGAKAHIRIQAPLILYNEDRTFTEEVGRLYGKYQ